MLEREVELEQFAGVLDRACVREGSAVVVHGPPGIGKTRLLREVCGAASERGMVVLSARGGEFERDLAFGIVRQLLGRCWKAESEHGPLRGAVGLARPVFELESGGAGREGALERILHGLYRLCAAVGDRSPLLLTIDDAESADLGSLRFVSYLARRLDGLAVALVLAARAAGGEEGRAIELVRAEPATLSRELRPLSEVAVGVLARAWLGEAMAPELARAVHGATGGNPFLVREMLGALLAEGVQTTDAAVVRVADVAPATITRSVLLRLGRLSEDAGRLARAAAMFGGSVALRLVAAHAELDDAHARRALDELVTATIFEPGGSLEFAHPILRRSVYLDIPAASRASSHARAALLLRDAGASPELVAAQLLLADPTADPRSISVLREAARRALAAGAPDAAATYLKRALSDSSAAGKRAELLYELANAEVALGAPTAVIRLREALAAAPDASHRAQIAIELVLMQGVFGHVDDLAELVEDVLGELTDPDHRALAERLESKLLFALEPGSAAHREHLARLREELGGSDGAGRLALAHVGYDLLRRCECSREEVLAIGARANAGGLLTAQGRTETWEKGLVGEAMLCADRFEEIRAMADEWQALAAAAGEQVYYGMQSAYRAQVAYRTGALPDAEADARAALDVERALGTRSRGSYIASSVLAKIELERGNISAARRLLDAVDDGSPLAIEFTAIESALVRIAGGDVRRAVDALLAHGAALLTQDLRNPALQPWRSAAALGLRLLNEHGQARSLADEEIALARVFGAPRALGIALRVRGTLAGGEEALALLGEALDVLHGSGAELERARALVEHGAALRRARQPSTARQPLRLGLDLAERCGAPLLAERAREELQASGARPRRALLAGVDSLTASERRIARLASEGQTNREIAQSLFLTTKTIEMHLGNAYRKLDIPSRDHLADALAQPALVDAGS